MSWTYVSLTGSLQEYIGMPKPLCPVTQHPGEQNLLNGSGGRAGIFWSLGFGSRPTELEHGLESLPAEWESPLGYELECSRCGMHWVHWAPLVDVLWGRDVPGAVAPHPCKVCSTSISMLPSALQYNSLCSLLGLHKRAMPPLTPLLAAHVGVYTGNEDMLLKALESVPEQTEKLACMALGLARWHVLRGALLPHLKLMHMPEFSARLQGMLATGKIEVLQNILELCQAVPAVQSGLAKRQLKLLFTHNLETVFAGLQADARLSSYTHMLLQLLTAGDHCGLSVLLRKTSRLPDARVYFEIVVYRLAEHAGILLTADCLPNFAALQQGSRMSPADVSTAAQAVLTHEQQASLQQWCLRTVAGQQLPAVGTEQEPGHYRCLALAFLNPHLLRIVLNYPRRMMRILGVIMELQDRDRELSMSLMSDIWGVLEQPAEVRLVTAAAYVCMAHMGCRAALQWLLLLLEWTKEPGLVRVVQRYGPALGERWGVKINLTAFEEWKLQADEDLKQWKESVLDEELFERSITRDSTWGGYSDEDEFLFPFPIYA